MTLRQPTERHGGNARFDEEVTVMVSSAVASLDIWLAQAEEVLRERRQQSLSPSSARSWDGAERESIVTLATLEDGLAQLLDKFCGRPGRWILVAEDVRNTSRFWQALAYEDGSLIVEVVSNQYLEGDTRLSATDEERLGKLGWDVPDPPFSPNWIRVEPTTSPRLGDVAQQAVETFRNVFRFDDEDRLRLKTFASPNRGRTPASELLYS